MNLRQRLDFIVPFLISLFLFCLSWAQRVSVICLVLLVIAWILSGRILSTCGRVKNSLPLLLMVVFFLLHVISLAYSSNMQSAIFDLQTKLPFLFFPFFFVAFSFTQPQVSVFKKWFVGGAVIACIVCLYHAFKQYSATNEVTYFFYERYSHFMHPAYFSIYLNVAILFLMELFFREEESKSSRWLVGVTMIFLFINITLLSSRTALVTSFITAAAYFVFIVLKNKTARQLTWPFVTILIVALMVQVMSAKVFNRFQQVATVIEQNAETSQAPVDSTKVISSTNSASVHITIWNNCISLISKHPLIGVGAGDVHDELNRQFIDSGFNYGVEKNYNAHNQFLNTAIGLGLIGMVVLIVLLFYSAFVALRERNWLLFLFISIITLNCLTESILERQAGVIFFAFFFSLFITEVNKYKSEAV